MKALSSEIYVGMVIGGRKIVGKKWYDNKDTYCWQVKCKDCQKPVSRTVREIREGLKLYCRRCVERYRVKKEGGRKKWGGQTTGVCEICGEPAIKGTEYNQVNARGVTINRYTSLCRSCFIKI